MTDSTLVKLIAMVSGLLFLSLLAALSGAHGYRTAEGLTLIALGACVVCYGLQIEGHKRLLWLLATAVSIASWGLGMAGFASFLMGR